MVWAVKHFQPYLYGQKCDVYTDHEALKALLNNPQPSGKLARWGMVIQELNLNIHYRPGKRNSNADTLSQSPLVEIGSGDTAFGIVSALSGNDIGGLSALQLSDPELAAIIPFLETGVLPQDKKFARSLL